MIFPTKISTSAKKLLPRSRLDGNDTPADKESAKFKYPAGGTNISSKTPRQVPLFTKHHEYITASSKPSKNQQQQHNTLPREKRTISEELQIRTQSNKVIIQNQTYTWRRHRQPVRTSPRLISAAFIFMYELYHLYMMK